MAKNKNGINPITLQSDKMAAAVAPAVEIVDGGNSKLITDQNGDVTTAGQQLTEQIKDESTTPEEVEGAVQAGLMLDKQVDENRSAIDNAINSVAPSVLSTPATPQQEYESGLPVGRSIQSVVQPTPTVPTVEQYGLGNAPLAGLTPEQIQMYAAQTAAYAPKKPLDLSIEQLGVQDYFPSIKDNIAVGSYSRKTLGSGNIYVAGGGVLPFGILDARKRALDKHTAEQKAIVDKIKDLNTDTADQYEQHFGDYVMDGLSSYLEAAGGDPTRLTNPNDPLAREYNRFAKNVEGVRKEIADTDARVKQILEDQKAGRYVAPETLKFALEYSQGKWDYVDDFLSGKKKVSDYNSKLQSFDNITSFANDAVERFSKVGPEERPLNLKAGIDPTKLATEISQAGIYKPGSSTDAYWTGVSKYYDVDKIHAFVDAAWEQNNFYKGMGEMTDEQRKKITEEGKASMASQIISQLSSQVQVKQELRENDNLERTRLALDRKKLELESATKYSFVNNFGNATQSYIKQIMEDPKLTPEQRSQKVAEVWTAQGNYNPGASQWFGTPANQVPLTDQEREQTMYSNKKDTKVRLKNSAGRWVETNLAQVEDDKKKAAAGKGYKPIFDQSDYQFKVAVRDLSTMEEAYGGLGVGIAYTTKQRFQTVSAVQKRGDKAAIIPFNYANKEDQLINTVHNEMNTAIKVPVMDNGKQKLDDNGKPMYAVKKLEGRYYTTYNLSDPTTQITLDTPMQTGQTNKNPNVGQ